MGGSKRGGTARVSCMGHLTRRFGRVSPQGKVIGWAINSIAVGLEELSCIIGAQRCTYTTRTKKSGTFRKVKPGE